MVEVTQTELQNAYLQAVSTYGDRASVTGIDIGYKYSGANNRRTKQISVRLHVTRKIQDSALNDAERFPKEIADVPVDVIEANYKKHAAPSDLTERKFPASVIQPGISVAHFKKSAGTIGLIVYDNLTQRPCLLSNWHVLAGNTPVKIGDPILQPGFIDGGDLLRNNVATLERYIIDVNGDAAIATLSQGRSFRPHQFESKVVITKTRMPRLGEVLEKSGRSTGITRAFVDGVGRYFVDYGMGRFGIDGFKLVAEKDGNPDNEEISAKGDSGSCWYAPQSAEGVGLHFAGETHKNRRAEHALACFLPRVLESLNVSLKPAKVKQPDQMVAVAMSPASSQVSEVDASIA